MSNIYYFNIQDNSSIHYKTSSSLLAFQLVERMQTILQPVEYFAGSYGLKPFKILLHPGILGERNDWNYRIAFSVRKGISKSIIDEHINKILQNKNYTPSSLLAYRKAIEDSIKEGNIGEKSWSEKLALNGLDILLHSAKQHGAKTSLEFIDSVDSLKNFPVESEEGYQIRFIVEIEFKPEEKTLLKTAGHLSNSLTNLKQKFTENYLKREIE